MSAVHTAVSTLAGVTEVKYLPMSGAEKAGLTGEGARSETSSSVGLREFPSSKKCSDFKALFSVTPIITFFLIMPGFNIITARFIFLH